MLELSPLKAVNQATLYIYKKKEMDYCRVLYNLTLDLLLGWMCSNFPHKYHCSKIRFDNPLPSIIFNIVKKDIKSVPLLTIRLVYLKGQKMRVKYQL